MNKRSDEIILSPEQIAEIERRLRDASCEREKYASFAPHQAPRALSLPGHE